MAACVKLENYYGYVLGNPIVVSDGDVKKVYSGRAGILAETVIVTGIQGKADCGYVSYVSKYEDPPDLPMFQRYVAAERTLIIPVGGGLRERVREFIGRPDINRVRRVRVTGI